MLLADPVRSCSVSLGEQCRCGLSRVAGRPCSDNGNDNGNGSDNNNKIWNKSENEKERYNQNENENDNKNESDYFVHEAAPACSSARLGMSGASALLSSTLPAVLTILSFECSAF